MILTLISTVSGEPMKMVWTKMMIKNNLLIFIYFDQYLDRISNLALLVWIESCWAMVL